MDRDTIKSRIAELEMKLEHDRELIVEAFFKRDRGLFDQRITEYLGDRLFGPTET